MTAEPISESAPAIALPSELVVTPTHQLEGIDLRSLAVFSALFYGAAFLALAIGVAVAWLLASVVGLVGQFEEFMRSIGFRDFEVVAPQVILGGLVLALALVVFLTVMTVLAAALYNVMAKHGRTVRVRFGEVPPPAPQEPPPGIEQERAPHTILRALRGSREAASHIAAMDGRGVPPRLQH
jgi:hypothetical protein